jgi:hypothetical protein
MSKKILLWLFGGKNSGCSRVEMERFWGLLWFQLRQDGLTKMAAVESRKMDSFGI